MDSRLLIDAIVQQTTVLIAQLSTAMGIRAPLSHVADQVFLDLAREIEAQGVSRKVVADMFGMALRAYQKKVQRLTAATSESHRTLWQAIYDYVGTAEQLTRDQVDARFKHDPAEHVAAVLNDLVQSGLVFASGRGSSSVYRQVPMETRSVPHAREALEDLLCLTIYRRRGATLAELREEFPADVAELEDATRRLVADQRVSSELDADGQERFRTERYVIAVGQRRGWEAAVFDHFSTVAAALAHKLRLRPGAQTADRVGGATLSFDIYPGHPNEQEVYGLLRTVRAQLNEVWNRVSTWNQAHAVTDDQKIKVSFYFGQNVWELDAAATDESEPSHDA